MAVSYKKSTEQVECPFCTLLTLHLTVKLKEWFF